MTKLKRKTRTDTTIKSVNSKYRHRKTKIETINNLSSREFEDLYLPHASSLHVTPEKNDCSHCLNPKFKQASELSNDEYDQCLNLIKETSEDDYKRSSMGWHPRHKRREMSETDMRYLLLNCESPDCESSTEERKPSPGFLSFMLTHDSTPSVPVLYIYEIHLPVQHRKHGAGRNLMKLAEEIATRVGVEKVMLTCFLSNEKAHGFYRSLGYETDVISPEDRKIRNKIVKADYAILSKRVGEASKRRRVDVVPKVVEGDDVGALLDSPAKEMI